MTQKAISKIEGRVVSLDGIEASEQAREIAGEEVDPRRIQVILDEAAELVRVRPPLVIARTKHGYVCGSAGVDASNAPGRDTLVLLPVDPDASAVGAARRAPRADGQSRSASSSPTRSAARGAPARPMSRSAPPVSRCCATCAALATRPATSCTRR